MINQENILRVDILSCHLDLDGEAIIHEIASKGKVVPISSKKEQEKIDPGHRLRVARFSEDRNIILPNTYLMAQTQKLFNDTVSKMLHRKYRINAMWGLTLEEGESLSQHSHLADWHIHRNEYYSIVYYPTASKDDANLIFKIPYGNGLEAQHVIEPSAGTMYLFQSWMEHYTTRQPVGNGPRTAISANLEPLNPHPSSRHIQSMHSKS